MAKRNRATPVLLSYVCFGILSPKLLSLGIHILSSTAQWRSSHAGFSFVIQRSEAIHKSTQGSESSLDKHPNMCTTYPLINRYSTLNEKHGLILGVFEGKLRSLV